MNFLTIILNMGQEWFLFRIIALILRFVMNNLHGIYLPVGGPSINPYGRYYHTQNIQCEFFVRF